MHTHKTESQNKVLKTPKISQIKVNLHNILKVRNIWLKVPAKKQKENKINLMSNIRMMKNKLLTTRWLTQKQMN